MSVTHDVGHLLGLGIKAWPTSGKFSGGFTWESPPQDRAFFWLSQINDNDFSGLIASRHFQWIPDHCCLAVYNKLINLGWPQTHEFLKPPFFFVHPEPSSTTYCLTSSGSTAVGDIFLISSRIRAMSVSSCTTQGRAWEWGSLKLTSSECNFLAPVSDVFKGRHTRWDYSLRLVAGTSRIVWTGHFCFKI